MHAYAQENLAVCTDHNGLQSETNEVRIYTIYTPVLILLDPLFEVTNRREIGESGLYKFCCHKNCIIYTIVDFVPKYCPCNDAIIICNNGNNNCIIKLTVVVAGTGLVCAEVVSLSPQGLSLSLSWPSGAGTAGSVVLLLLVPVALLLLLLSSSVSCTSSTSEGLLGSGRGREGRR